MFQFRGKISAVQEWDYVLSPWEIRKIYYGEWWDWTLNLLVYAGGP